jgi:general secretion pathway protein C
MGRIAIWSANTCLFVLCCWLVAASLNQVAAAMLTPAAAAPPVRARPEPLASQRSFAERQVILDRKLFDVSTLVPSAPPSDEQEQLEATRLPLRLLGTAASSRPELSWAAVEDQDQRKELVVKLGDELAGQAKVVGIERRRIILENRGQREELALEEDAGKASAPRSARTRGMRRPNRPPRAAARPANTPAAEARVRRLAENRFQVNRQDVVELAGRNPAEIFSSARILPKYDGGQMVGIQLNNVKEGSLFQEIGIQDGDTITQFNGIQIDSPQGSAEVLRELTQAERFEVTVTGADGKARTLTYEVAE